MCLIIYVYIYKYIYIYKYVCIRYLEQSPVFGDDEFNHRRRRWGSCRPAMPSEMDLLLHLEAVMWWSGGDVVARPQSGGGVWWWWWWWWWWW